MQKRQVCLLGSSILNRQHYELANAMQSTPTILQTITRIKQLHIH